MDGMKETGVRWIGAVPSAWSLLKMKHYSYMKGRIGWQGLTADEFIDEGPYLITGTDFENGRVCWDRCYHVSEKRYNEAVPIQVHVGDLLVTKDGTIGKLAYIDELPGKASLNSHLLVIRPIGDKFINRFLYWMLYSSVFEGYYDLVSYGSTMDSLSQEKIGEFAFYAPSVGEQEAIADYLDRECAKLDEIIETIEKQIEILQKQKRSIISRAVIKGISRDAVMRDSGIPWLGHIPSHWRINRLKYCCSVKTGPFGTQLSADEYTETGTPIVNVKNIGYGNIIEEDLDYIPDEVKKRLSVHILQAGDIVFGRKGAVDKHAIIDERHEGWVQGSDCMRLRIYGDIVPEFLNYYFGSSGYSYYVLSSSVGSTMASVNSQILNDSIVVYPEVDEQRRIVKYLDMTMGRIDAILERKKAQLLALRNYRRTVIYEYVTGKKRVKEVQQDAHQS